RSPVDHRALPSFPTRRSSDLALVAAIAVGALVGLLYGFLYTRLGLPSFVITLAGLLGFLGLQLWVLGDTGSISLPFDSWIVQFRSEEHTSELQSRENLVCRLL